MATANTTDDLLWPLDDGPADLAPSTLDRLIQFGRRRKAQRFAQGLGWVVAIAIAVLFACVTADAFVTAPFVRLLCSLLFYSSTFGAVIYFAVRPWSQPSHLVEEAKLLETKLPDVRGLLLSAVELSEDGSRHAHSRLFCQSLQRQCGQLMQTVDVTRSLPWRDTATVFYWPAGFVIVLLGLCLFSPLRMPHRLARILAPTAELGRVTRYAVSLEAPMPHTKLVPFGEVISVRAHIDGPPTDKVVLETETDGQRARIPLLSVASPDDKGGTNPPSRALSSQAPFAKSQPMRFQSTLVADSESVRYRVVVEGASSPWYEITTRPRPSVSRSIVEIIPPDYARQSILRTEGPLSDIRALHRSRAHLRLFPTEPVSRATLRWIDKAGKTSADETKLEFDANTGSWETELLVEQPRSFRVFLQSTATGFTSEFSTSYAVQPLADSPPEIAWRAPGARSLTTHANSLINMRLEIQDELPIDELRYSVKVNGQDHGGSKLPFESADSDRQDPWRYTETVDWQFDLQSYRLSAGDLVELKVAATDRMEQTGETAPLFLHVAPTTLALRPTRSEMSRLNLARLLEKLASDAATIQERLSEGEYNAAHDNQLNGVQDNSLQPNAPLADGQQAFSSLLESTSPALLAEILPLLADSGQSVDATEMLMVGEHLIQLLGRTRRLSTLDSDARAGEMQSIAKDVRQLASSMRTAVTFDVVRRHAIAMLEMSSSFLAFKAAEEDAAILMRQQLVLVRQLKEIQQAMLESVTDVRRDSQDRMRQGAENLGHLIANVERQSSNASVEKIQESASAAVDHLDSARLLARLDGGLYEALKQTQRHLHFGGLSPGQAFAWSLTTLDEDGAVTGGSFAQGKDGPGSLVDYLQSARDLHRTSELGSRSFSADLGQVSRAASQAIQSAEQSNIIPTLQRLQRAIDTLHAIETVHLSSSNVNRLVRGEQSNLNNLASSSLERPRQWTTFGYQIEVAVRNLKQAGLPPELADRLDRLRWNSEASLAGRRIETRLWSTELPTSAEPPLQGIQAELAAILELLQPYAEQAREEIGTLAPSLAELATRAAEVTSELSQETDAAAEAFANNTVPNENTRLNWLQSVGEETMPVVAELRNALVDEADAKDLLDQSGIDAAQRLDAAIAVVDSAEERTLRSMDTIAVQDSSAPAEQRVEELERAAGQQRAASSAFAQLATILQQDDSALETSQDTQELWGIVSEIDSHMVPEPDNSLYDQARELAELAASNPEQLLGQLEEELQVNSEMQVEMSDLARAAATQALQNLETAAEQQSEIGAALESSDPYAAAEKKRLTNDIQLGRELTRYLRDLFIKESQWAAGAAQASKVAERAGEVQARLDRAYRESDGATDRQSLQLLRATGTQLAEELAAAATTMRELRVQLEPHTDREIHQNGADLNNRRREMRERWRKLQQQDVRNLQQTVRGMQQRLRQSGSLVNQGEQRLRNEQNKLKQLEQRAAKDKKPGRFEDQLQRQRQQVAFREASLDAAREGNSVLEARVNEIEQALQASNRRNAPDLDSVNPSAQLADQVLDVAIQKSVEAAGILDSREAHSLPEFRSTEAQVRQSIARESEIIDRTVEAADALARAARHERRLQHEQTGAAFSKEAENATAIEENFLARAQAAFEEAGQETQESATNQASAAKSQQATQASDSAAAALADSASRLSGLLAKPEATSQRPETNESAPPSSTPLSQQLSAEQLAQLLNELDQQLFSQLDLGAKEDDASAAPSTPNSEQSNTLNQAAQSLASEMSELRSQASGPSNTDIGQATDPASASSDPQGPVPVQIIDAPRLGSDWGALRERRAENSIESGREQIDPRFRAQVDAYFKRIAEKANASPATNP